ncbi:MAG: hypothetical protein EPN38_08980 [Rhodanobacteraceae bacterium]|nr:MAG: hypothetical protein EPN38_08980 [Rhodanobacteraceae bacterium]
MRKLRWLQPFPVLALLLPGLLAACAPAPIYKTTAGSFVAATPAQVATAPANFRDLQVVWGGRVVSLQNFTDHSELEVLAYPLDASQRPRPGQPPTGRFIAIMPGFVEPMNFPDGSLVTLRGTLAGTRSGTVGQAPYTFTVVHGAAIHHWTAAEMRQGHPNISLGVGVGGWIH